MANMHLLCASCEVFNIYNGPTDLGLSNERVCSDDVQSGDTKDPPGVVDVPHFEHLTHNRDSRVDL